MEKYSGLSHVTADMGRPSIMFEDLPPNVDPIRYRAGFNILGQNIDDLIRSELDTNHQKELLDSAKRSVVTQFSRQSLAGTTWGLGYATGFVGGGVGGWVGGFLAMAVATSAVEQLTGVSVTDTINTYSPEIARISSETGEYISGGINWATSYLNPVIGQKINEAISTFQSQVFGTITGVKLATFTGNKVGASWYGSGDRLGESLGTRIASPLVKLHDKIPFSLPQLRLPRINFFKRDKSVI